MTCMESAQLSKKAGSPAIAYRLEMLFAYDLLSSDSAKGLSVLRPPPVSLTGPPGTALALASTAELAESVNPRDKFLGDSLPAGS